MCDKVILKILENGGILKSVPDCYKSQEKCNKVVDNCHHTLKVVREYYKNQKMCGKAITSCLHTIKLVSKCFMIQDMCDKTVNRCLFVFDSIPYQNNTRNYARNNTFQNPRNV